MGGGWLAQPANSSEIKKWSMIRQAFGLLRWRCCFCCCCCCCDASRRGGACMRHSLKSSTRRSTTTPFLCWCFKTYFIDGRVKPAREGGRKRVQGQQQKKSR